jgi:hypothetical protein
MSLSLFRVVARYGYDFATDLTDLANSFNAFQSTFEAWPRAINFNGTSCFRYWIALRVACALVTLSNRAASSADDASCHILMKVLGSKLSTTLRAFLVLFAPTGRPRLAIFLPFVLVFICLLLQACCCKYFICYPFMVVNNVCLSSYSTPPSSERMEETSHEHVCQDMPCSSAKFATEVIHVIFEV